MQTLFHFSTHIFILIFFSKANQPISRLLVEIEYTMNKLRMDIEKKVRKLNKDKLSMDEQTELEDVILLLIDELSEQMLEHQGCKLEKDLVVMRDARLIGMTTTSAARLRALLDNLQPSISELVSDHFNQLTSQHGQSKEWLHLSFFEISCMSQSIHRYK